jgi:putative FmdB family regulatory protein
MPIYEYFCADCHTKFNALRPMSQADAPIACDQCEGEHTARVLSVFIAVSGGKALDSMAGGACACGGHCGCGHAHSHN